jgi:transcription initiation factor TFIID subunit 1
VALTYAFRQILDERIKTMQESWPFMKPVNKKIMKHYYDVIKNPMELETVEKKVATHQYHSREEFIRDIELIHSNSLTFNGADSEYTAKAKKILDVVVVALAPFDEQLSKLEEEIK